MGNKRKPTTLPIPDMCVAQCVPSPPVDHNEHIRKLVKLEGALAAMWDDWFEGCDEVRKILGAEVSKRRLGIRW